MTYVVMDNMVYGLTKQACPTSTLGYKSKTDVWAISTAR